MNAEFIKSRHKVICYGLKAPTKSSFYRSSGPIGIFPERLSFYPYSGKVGKRAALYQIDGKYKVLDGGLYKPLDNGKVHTKIMEIQGFPSFTGWGEIDERHQIYDLIIIFSTNQCKHSFEIHHFRGMAKPEYLHEVCNYLQSFLKRA
jgi:hypothetical protein